MICQFPKKYFSSINQSSIQNPTGKQNPPKIHLPRLPLPTILQHNHPGPKLQPPLPVRQGRFEGALGGNCGDSHLPRHFVPLWPSIEFGTD